MAKDIVMRKGWLFDEKRYAFMAGIMAAALLAGSVPPGVPPVYAAEEEGLPSKLDLRDRGVVTHVKDQGRMGTCWGFA